MIVRNLGKIAEMSGGELWKGDPGKTVRGVESDSRIIEPGMLFIPLIGARTDGHRYVEGVLEKGGFSLWQRDHLPWPDGVILVDDTLKALQDLASAYARGLDTRIVAITGSNGKTGTKDWLAAIASRDTKAWKTRGNRNSEVGYPLTLLELDEDTGMAIVEMGMEKAGEIAQLAALADLDMAIITSIGSAHLENFADRSGIARAKLEIAQGLKEGSLLLWPASSPELMQIMETLPQENPHLRFESFGKEADHSIDIETMEGHSLIHVDGRSYQVPAFGFQALNAAAAAAAAQSLGISENAICQGLEEADLTPHRGVVLPFGKGKILDDTYKSNPESAMMALDMMLSIPASRKIAVLSDMLDLGKDSPQLHREVGDHALENGIELISWGELARDITAGRGTHYESREDLVRDLMALKDEDVLILIKGSHAMKMDEIVDRLTRQERG